MSMINKVSPARLGKRGDRIVRSWIPEQEESLFISWFLCPLLLCVDICCCIHYLCKLFSDKWILNLCYLNKATNESIFKKCDHVGLRIDVVFGNLPFIIYHQLFIFILFLAFKTVMILIFSLMFYSSLFLFSLCFIWHSSVLFSYFLLSFPAFHVPFFNSLAHSQNSHYTLRPCLDICTAKDHRTTTTSNCF